MAGKKKYRRERRTRKSDPKIRWTKKQQNRLHTAISAYNEMAESMAQDERSMRTGVGGVHSSAPRTLDYEQVKGGIKSAHQLKQWESMLLDLSNTDISAYENKGGRFVNVDWESRVTPYLDKEKARIWNLRENYAEKRGFSSWDEMPPSQQRAAQSRDNSLTDPNGGSYDERLFSAMGFDTPAAERFYENYSGAMEDNGFSDESIDIIEDIMDQLRKEGNLADFFEKYGVYSEIDIPYLYNGTPESPSPYKIDYATREKRVVDFWIEKSAEYGVEINA